MNTKSKIWLGVGAFAIVQAAGLSMEAGLPKLTLAQPAQAADGTCGWERSREGRWIYDQNCERGERYVNRSNNHNERGDRWNNRGRNNERGDRWNEQGDRWQHGERGERWGERG